MDKCTVGQVPPRGICRNAAATMSGRCHWSTCFACALQPEAVRTLPVVAMYQGLIVESKRQKAALLQPDLRGVTCHCGFGDCPICHPEIT